MVNGAKSTITAAPYEWIFLESTTAKSAKGIKWSFIFLWLMGAFFSSIYAIYYKKYMLLPNYLIGGLGTLVILYIRVKEHISKGGN